MSYNKLNEKIFFNVYLFFGCAGSLSLLYGLFSSCGEQGLLSSCVHKILIAVAFLEWSTGSRAHGPRTDSVVVVHGPSCPAARGVFPDQGSNLCLMHWHVGSLPLSHQGSPVSLFMLVIRVKKFLRCKRDCKKCSIQRKLFPRIYSQVVYCNLSESIA